jgi:predicted dehydrogenase
VTAPLNIAQVGVGYWGKNLLRNFAALPTARVVAVCEQREDLRHEVAAAYPQLTVTARYDEVLTSPDVEAVILATETPRHYELALAALRAGKHVFVEKPMARTADEARELVEEAASRDLRLMVGHLLLFHPAFRYVEDLIRAGDLGDVYYLHSQRVNLGIIRKEENAFESLAPHDLSVALTLLDGSPVAVSAQGQSYVQRGVEDVAFATVYFDNGQLAHLHTSWLDPQKVRKVTVVGSRRMAVIDDVSGSEKVRLFDKGIDVQPGDPRYVEYAETPTVRDGDILIPHIRAAEPLRLECEHFIDCVQQATSPKSDGRHGLAVVQIMEAAQRSIKQKGSCVEIKSLLR